MLPNWKYSKKNDAATTDAATKTGFTGSIISVGCNEDSIGMALKGMKFVDVCGPYEGERPPFVVEVNIKESWFVIVINFELSKKFYSTAHT